ncbi:porin [Burkholderia pyrrocinia]|uniref:porin n=1 Tax=Burkholderia pyrrocinia TaxID=60550 RepID=UPI0030D5DDC0
MEYWKKSPKSLFLAAAFALMGSAGGARAQSSVTLYGVLDTGIFYTNRTFDPATGESKGHKYSVISSGPGGAFWGITGEEDIGGGTKAIFTLESGLDTSNGAVGNSNGNFFGRKAYIGLTGNFGTLKIGEQLSPFAFSFLEVNPRSSSYFGSGTLFYIDSVLVTGAFTPNALTYTSPEIAGLQGSAMVALGGAAGDFHAGRQYSARLRYHWKNLVVDGAVFSGNSGGTAASTPISTTVEFFGRTIGMSYAWGAATLTASYQMYKVAGSFDEKVYSAGGQYLFTPALMGDMGVWYARDGNDGSNHSLMIATGLHYYLSKRTSIYTDLAYVNNHGIMHTGMSVNGALYGPTGSSTGFVMGIRHLF